MTAVEIRVEACRLAIAACARDLPIDDRVAEINGLMLFFEKLLTQPAEPVPDAEPDYPRIGR